MDKEYPLPKLIIKSQAQYNKIMKQYDSIPENLDAGGHIIVDSDYWKRMDLADSMMNWNYRFSVSDKTKFANVDWKKVGRTAMRDKK